MRTCRDPFGTSRLLGSPSIVGTEFTRFWLQRITWVRFSPAVGAICRPPMSKITSFHPIQAKQLVRYHIPQTNASVFCNHAFRLDRRRDLLQNRVERTVPPSNNKLKAPWHVSRGHTGKLNGRCGKLHGRFGKLNGQFGKLNGQFGYGTAGLNSSTQRSRGGDMI